MDVGQIDLPGDGPFIVRRFAFHADFAARHAPSNIWSHDRLGKRTQDLGRRKWQRRLRPLKNSGR